MKVAPNAVCTGGLPDMASAPASPAQGRRPSGPGHRAGQRAHQRAMAWRQSAIMLAAAWAAILIAFARDVADMAVIWWDISTYNHVLLIPFILGWLVMQRWPQLKLLRPTGWWPGLIPAFGAALLWLIGDMAGLALARHLAVIVLLQSAVLTVLGPRVAMGLLFPLFFALFMLPIGEELVPWLQTITADITMFLLGYSGFPATIDGVFITTPTGYFEVAESCSGVKFLIAMIAYGALVSNVCFTSLWRRGAFMAVSIIVPIIANGIRAWGTIFIAHHTSIEFAAGFDHIFYGWIFFALVLLLVMAIGWRFFDRRLDDPMIDARSLATSNILKWLAGFRLAAGKGALAIGVILMLALGWSHFAASRSAVIPPQLHLPHVEGWHLADYQPASPWKPRADGADHTLFGTYRNDDGVQVQLFFAAYASQSEGRELGGFGQGAFDPGSQWSWMRDLGDIAGGHGERIEAPGPVNRDAVTFYRLGTTTTGSATRIKLATIAQKLRAGNDPALLLVVSAEDRGGISGEAAVRQFLASMGDPAAVADAIVRGG